MEKIKLSIIIPIYNTEQYLKQCLESILSQNVSNIEIVMVDDGSTDDSSQICDEYAKRNSNMKVIHQPNKGLSGARNTGIHQASGEYLMFLDSDDFIHPSVNLQRVLSQVETDILQYKFVYYYEEKNKYVFLNDYVIDNNIDGDVLNSMYQYMKKNYLTSTATDKIIKRSFIMDNQLYFKEGIVAEDLEWVMRVYQKVQSYQLINENVYVYRQQRRDAITKTVKEKNINDIFATINYWYHYSYDNELKKNTYLGFLAYHYVIILAQLNHENCTDEKKKEILQCRDILNYGNSRKVILCNRLFHVFGLKIGLWILKNYIKLKNKGIVKIS